MQTEPAPWGSLFLTLTPRGMLPSAPPKGTIGQLDRSPGPRALPLGCTLRLWRWADRKRWPLSLRGGATPARTLAARTTRLRPQPRSAISPRRGSQPLPWTAAQ